MPKGLFKSTKPERRVIKELKKLNLKYHLNHTIKSGYNVDVFIPDLNLCIEVQGCFWHVHSKCGFDKVALTEAQEKNLARDKIKIPLVSSLYNTIWLWECEINERGFSKRFRKLFEEARSEILAGKKFEYWHDRNVFV
jgi:DNA mismatch endonuclease (patch repair protein)